MIDQNCGRAFCGVLLLLAAGTTFGDEPPPPAPQKVVLQVELKVIEVNADKLKSLGFAWSQIGQDGVKQASFADFVQSLKNGKSADEVDGFLSALQENGLAHTLAEPTIATLSGRPASLAVGNNTARHNSHPPGQWTRPARIPARNRSRAD